MKKILFAFLCAIPFTSCSDSDVTDVKNVQQSVNEITDEPEDEPEIAAYELDSVIQYSGGNASVFEFSNNKMVKQSIGNQLFYEYSYNQDGQLSSMTGKDEQGNINFTRSVSYGADKRIIAKNDTYYNNIQNTTSTENVTYIYNNANNTVTADFDSYDEYAQDRVYHFNAAGLLSKITTTDGTDIQVYEYNGNNISQMTSGSIYGFTYDNVTAVKGEYLNMYRNQFKNYSSYIVYTGYMVVKTVTHNYLSQFTDYSGVANYTYQFNAEGYPVEVNVNHPTANDEQIVIKYKPTE
ncbi:hypothetical protein FMM05_14975 [Flavobacterium zepuense]|uniref:DUF4595 domain-containing protein n=1 Tax=Flavobacterium zepuense TaxID=2593302 RepID=A0A552UXQ9_9FLAO|nr:hypothetical protein [Flavobacterium zepuense]TRW22998.1 hypothetical protein FMM05_14975 [Flavobacterium zepuense]